MRDIGFSKRQERQQYVAVPCARLSPSACRVLGWGSSHLVNRTSKKNPTLNKNQNLFLKATTTKKVGVGF